ncbi:acetoacetate metabolism regulatory protein AtoC [Candidatus Methylomirabilis lanthanidiphila]|uniref:DNA-binding transcriptional regulator NtrC n=1 Tax=Candidatus Methylomirabilis lanthanidiphila TaxID=2211376 RepID=A0A564ZIW4_9BACT|nr:sigma-54 dependent transcriptional regulator [Candidatus Methylomirabilis lanthanidiphila]VUZ85123.1 acetoacetate metabolism regulatory protein AtoC [Candidatus Methylomirabilis lanthanidiphila]
MNPTRQILVVDDEESIRWALRKALEREGHRVVLAANGVEGLARAAEPGIDLVLMDIKMPGAEGLETLSKIKEARPELPVIIMTAFGTLQAAVQAMKRGAYDYITKPFDFGELTIAVQRVFEIRELTERVAQMEALGGRPFDFGGVVGLCPAMQQIFKLVGKMAASDLTVLIRGESGTGKELLAKAIHYNSRRSARPFVAINCAAIPRELLESELFGHERGAFTGASALRRGKFELAEGGTIFLDEIGDMDIGLQAKILRVLQERQFERVGGERSLSADVRVIAATNQYLEAAVAQKSFREDLYYRLNVVAITLPPLRERIEDIPLLVNHFLHQFAEEQKQEPKSLPPETLELMLAYRWPGNVRELENAVKRACVLAPTSLILPEHLPAALLQAEEAGAASGRSSFERVLSQGITGELARLKQERDGQIYAYFLAALERPLLLRVLERTGGNQLRAAELLGINRNTLRKKLRELGIAPGRGDEEQTKS